MSDQSENNEQIPAHTKNREVKGMFDGPVIPVIIKLAVPMLVGMVVQILYTLVDTFFISRIDLADPSYIGGTGIIFPIIFFAMAVANGLAVGMSSLVARAIGEKNNSIMEKTAESGLFMAVIASVVFIITFYVFTDQLIGLLGAQGDYFIHAKEYMHYIIPAGVVIFIMYVFIGILQGEGLMKYVMIAMIIGTVGNIILDPIFIFVLNMEVRGAALATTIAQTIACVYLVIVFLKGKSSIKIEFHIKNISTKVMKQIMAIGVPQALGMMLMSFSFFIFNRIVIGIDENALTAFTLAGRFDQIVLMPIFAISGALITLIGQNAGRGLIDRAKSVWYNSIILSVISVTILAGLMVLLAPLIYKGFSDVPEVLYYAVLQTRIVEFTFLFAAIAILARSVFQALGFSIPAMLIMVMRILGFSLPFMFLFVFVFNLGMHGVWFGMIAGSILGAVVGFFWIEQHFRKLKSGELKIRSTVIDR